jgi:Fe2+ transport system protein FeoA
MTLSDLEVGKSGRVLSVGCEGVLRRRLFEMGITPRTVVTVRKTAPLGDPIELYLRGYLLTLRLEDADQIEIEEVAADNGTGSRRKSKQRQNHFVQSINRGKPTRGQLPGRNGRAKDRETDKE